MTHEQVVEFVRGACAPRLNETEKARLLGAKLVYGAGSRNRRGLCMFEAWQTTEAHVDLIEISALCEESRIQLVCTAIHEMAHCLAGPGAGHGKRWKQAAKQLGLQRALAAGQDYTSDDIDAGLWNQLSALPEFSDGRPVGRSASMRPRIGQRTLAAPHLMPPPCPLGIGANGGISRGPGSGSRLRLYMCQCVPVVRVRVASDHFNALCLACKSSFKRKQEG
jgi:hypothetical protein